MGPLRCEDHLLGARLAFNELKKLRSHFPKLNLELSMGMSQDYELALELGSQWVRVGSKIFRHDIK
jgi:uncharacterized pyridoxal phosphate-containing UPF0001 family protein